MTVQQFVIDLEGDQRAIVEGEDTAWLREALQKEPGAATRLRLRYDEADTQGHGVATPRISVIAESDDDTEGHSMSIHFPSVEDADAFRKRLLVAGVLAGSVALGAVGGMGLANMNSGDAATAGAAGTVAGSAWTQDERPNAAAAAGAAAGSAWTQDERANAAAAETAAGSAWTQDERQADEGAVLDDGQVKGAGVRPE